MRYVSSPAHEVPRMAAHHECGRSHGDDEWRKTHDGFINLTKLDGPSAVRRVAQ
jgi:hypothetical protein